MNYIKKEAYLWAFEQSKLIEMFSKVPILTLQRFVKLRVALKVVVQSLANDVLISVLKFRLKTVHYI